MDQSDFEQTLLRQYTEELEVILMECEHDYRLTIDYELLDYKIHEMISAAKIDGLAESRIWEMVEKRIPSYINFINSKMYQKKAA